MADITIVGTITEPALRFTQSGKAVLGFSLAENHSKKDQNGQWQDDGTTWRKVSVWDRKAEALAEVLQKGDRVIVVGTERMREFEAKDGSKGQSLELNAREVGKVPKLQKQDQGGGYRQGGYTGQEHQPQGGWAQNPQTDPWASGPSGEPPF
ncbi:single-strand binding protein [Brevibacterium sanguinis]|uniref:Single-stranded DNA-binding protein n=2 Tax=Brevibacterium TaxID=1696 RepID=A0A366INY2_9MICO|nr:MULTISPECIES: single-stranded DNA-binding protein [Brevibacterium]RBP66397.1 single-strand binding protein [Brevibacterium sanguinis]RBP73049.1 single-strand binding protein [Brevibacterium celere]